jgi:hypothetical protein
MESIEIFIFILVCMIPLSELQMFNSGSISSVLTMLCSWRLHGLLRARLLYTNPRPGFATNMSGYDNIYSQLSGTMFKPWYTKLALSSLKATPPYRLVASIGLDHVSGKSIGKRCTEWSAY